MLIEQIILWLLHTVWAHIVTTAIWIINGTYYLSLSCRRLICNFDLLRLLRSVFVLLLWWVRLVVLWFAIRVVDRANHLLLVWSLHGFCFLWFLSSIFILFLGRLSLLVFLWVLIGRASHHFIFWLISLVEDTLLYDVGIFVEHLDDLLDHMGRQCRWMRDHCLLIFNCRTIDITI